ncbi:hypothetical protein PHPALM_30733 [Phytophthora palmivora]|uniref:Uncharacterized protein n=1 Tax=Phytophthora palmivora TaxID=4796 RepID=A0A2P4X4E0_9STRA|nr:hypothetical protein PHPALM_30733 [Phytophthora palmivora]
MSRNSRGYDFRDWILGQLHATLFTELIRLAFMGCDEQPFSQFVQMLSICTVYFYVYALDLICVEALRAVMEGGSVAAKRSIASKLPDRYGLIHDGWTHMSEHYLGVFACIEVNGQVKTPYDMYGSSYKRAR